MDSDRGDPPPPSPAGGQASLWGPPPEPQTDCRTLPPQAGCSHLGISLEAQGLLLVPRPRSRITGPPPPSSF
ncbi:hypothetical protein NQZ68_025997 [Dissostichus eleginoides]|nr:hypothetical protein NQZ68_025997 [Dissostichus eleginoides]